MKPDRISRRGNEGRRRRKALAHVVGGKADTTDRLGPV